MSELSHVDYNGELLEIVDSAARENIIDTKQSLEAHLNDTDNPHEISAEKIGALSTTGDSKDNTTTFSAAVTRSNIASGEKHSTIFGKIAKFFADLKTVAFTGSYSDLVDKPTIPEAVAVKGNAESTYRTGNVNLTPANLGITVVNNTADADKNVKYANSAGNAATADNANKLGGMLPSYGNVKNTIVARDENGHVYLRHIYSDTGNNANPTVSQIIVTDGGNFFQKASLAHLKSQMGLDAVNNTADANKTVKSAGTCTGNSATATKLQTARTINGTSFNGSANITTATWGTARTVTIGNTGKSVNGSGNVSWSLSEIGAAASSHTHPYLPLSGGKVIGVIGATDCIYTDNTAHFYANIGTSLGEGGHFYAKGNNTYLVANNNSTQTYLQLQARSAVQCLATGSETTFIPCKASSYPGSSSRRYKDNIVPMTEEEARKILDIETVTFDYKKGIVFDSERFGKRGVIAEDVVDVIPSVVLYADIDGLGNVPDSVDYSKFAPYLIKMVQMQQEDINFLKETISDLLGRIEQLENR